MSKYSLLITILISLCTFSFKAFCLSLEGIWVEDKTQAMGNHVFESTTSRESQLKKCLEPKTIFSDGIAFVWQPEQSCIINTKSVKINSYHAQFSYAVIAELEDAIVAKNKEQINGSESIEIYRFVDDDTFWIYYYGEKNQDRIHLRVYYKRLKDQGHIDAVLKEFKEM